MFAYASRRIVATIPVMLVVAFFVFSLLYLAPGDPAAIIAGDQATPADVDRIRASLGLDRQAALWEVMRLRDDALPMFDGTEEDEVGAELPEVKAAA